ncbi:hypothetical protein H5410_041298 [Solanum commersonii]|uniref:Uncharacterized protein n=1 Tax=Solanum commersonii TaxID=4109 RepID=A0A9J5XUD3_SOLCO|nr:hypothetical protein H5410_041298 [Solanum commersonii]
MDRTICKMIVAVATDEGIHNLGMAFVKNREDAVYTPVLTILEHFNIYGITQKQTGYWKARFIDDLPLLFAERVHKALRGNNIEIPYKDLTYGKIIGTCT